MLNLTTEGGNSVYVPYHAIKKLVQVESAVWGMGTRIHFLDGTTQVIRENLDDVGRRFRELSCK